MATLNKEKTLFLRDGEGNLLPQEIELELLDDKPTIKAIPVLRGDLQKIQNAKDNPEEAKEIDKQIILNNCIEPKYTEAEAKILKPDVANAIVLAVMSISVGKTQKEIMDLSRDRIVNDAFLQKQV